MRMYDGQKLFKFHYSNVATDDKMEAILNINNCHFYRSEVMVLVILKNARTQIFFKNPGLLSL